jgi:hypothetical protein
MTPYIRAKKMKDCDKIGWERTLVKSKDIKWQHKVRNTSDGKLDFDIHLPLTAIIQGQARRSYAQGMIDMMAFHVKHQEASQPIDIDDLYELFLKAGFPEIAERIKGQTL